MPYLSTGLSRSGETLLTRVASPHSPILCHSAFLLRHRDACVSNRLFEMPTEAAKVQQHDRRELTIDSGRDGCEHKHQEEIKAKQRQGR